MDERPDAGDKRAPGRDGFPGGTPRLPRLSSPLPIEHVIEATDDEPAVMFVGGGFVDDELTRRRSARRGGPTGDVDDVDDADGDHEPAHASFTDYSPNESLFYTHEVEEVVETPAPTPNAALGVAPDATWDDIKAAHRKLMAELHPDRFVTAPEAARRDAEERLVEVNLAFHTLAKERRAS